MAHLPPELLDLCFADFTEEELWFRLGEVSRFSRSFATFRARPVIAGAAPERGTFIARGIPCTRSTEQFASGFTLRCKDPSGQLEADELAFSATTTTFDQDVRKVALSVAPCADFLFEALKLTMKPSGTSSVLGSCVARARGRQQQALGLAQLGQVSLYTAS
jgi:hypothetical protein